jgi:hypothetical protein
MRCCRRRAYCGCDCACTPPPAVWWSRVCACALGGAGITHAACLRKHVGNSFPPPRSHSSRPSPCAAWRCADCCNERAAGDSHLLRCRVVLSAAVPSSSSARLRPSLCGTRGGRWPPRNRGTDADSLRLSSSKTKSRTTIIQLTLYQTNHHHRDGRSHHAFVLACSCSTVAADCASHAHPVWFLLSRFLWRVAVATTVVIAASSAVAIAVALAVRQWCWCQGGAVAVRLTRGYIHAFLHTSPRERRSPRADGKGAMSTSDGVQK